MINLWRIFPFELSFGVRPPPPPPPPQVEINPQFSPTVRHFQITGLRASKIISADLDPYLPAEKSLEPEMPH